MVLVIGSWYSYRPEGIVASTSITMKLRTGRGNSYTMASHKEAAWLQPGTYPDVVMNP